MALTDSYVKRVFTPVEQQDALEKERAKAYLEEAGLEGQEVDKLRNTQLSTEEALSAKSEQLEYARQKKGRREDWEEFADAKRRMGRVLHHSEFIRKLRGIIPSLIVERAMVNGQISLYVVRNTPVKDVPGCPFKDRTHFDCVWYAGWLDLGWMPEYEIDKTNDAGVAIGQKRGWRTALLRLQARCREKNQKQVPDPFVHPNLVEETFGYPTNGPTASWYRKGLCDFRHGRFHTNPNVAFT
jgi:hypothetical protein